MTASPVRRCVWTFVSNMYPSADDVSYGAFVQRSREDLISQGFNIEAEILIRGRSSGLARLRAYAKHYSALALLLLQPRLRHLYIHYASHHCLLPALGARFLGLQVLVNIHGDDLALARVSLYRRVMKTGQSLLLRSARMIVVPSPYFRDLLMQTLPDINPNRVVVSPSSGIDFQSLSAATRNRASYWQQDQSSRIANFGYIGRIDADKGWEVLFDAFIQLPDSLRRRAQLHFWGDGKEASRLRERIAMEAAGQVTHHGAVPAAELPAAHTRFDFHVVPSSRESLGLAAIEGLGAGHVLICSRIRPFTDITVDGVSALHFDPTSACDLGAVLARALEASDETLAALAANGQALARAFDRAIVAADLAEHIDLCFPV
ncbi:glycosyltransferase family 4 protein [Roseateles sp. BYS78W]|uniref:Glycosyltransferase family 4 protein n=1 Tax=Pelomonas candidula TaxID=3299025 RepID=A0ABW7HAN0_9BURK